MDVLLQFELHVANIGVKFSDFVLIGLDGSKELFKALLSTGKFPLSVLVIGQGLFTAESVAPVPLCANERVLFYQALKVTLCLLDAEVEVTDPVRLFLGKFLSLVENSVVHVLFGFKLNLNLV